MPKPYALSLTCSETKKIFEGRFSKKLPLGIHRLAARKLTMRHFAKMLKDLGIPPSNRSETRGGDRSERYRIPINRQRRICFNWDYAGAHQDEIVDYPCGGTMRDFPPIHPGEIHPEEFLKPMGINQYRLARNINVLPLRFSKSCNRHSGMNADTALRLAR
jgi:proteic killer suppression protein